MGPLPSMSPAKVDVPAFLRAQKRAFLEAVKTGEAKEWILVTGNESADLDSLVSALVFAYMAQATSLSPGRKYIPFYQQASTLLQLRAENTFAFERVQLSVAEHVVLLDDVQTDKLAAAGVGIALVDLNRLDAIFGNARVVSILDHHQDEGLYPDVKPRLVKVPVGSCASLVTIFFREHLELLPAELAELLLSAMLVDTANFKASAGKATPTDHEALRLIKDHLLIFLSAMQLDTKSLFEDLKRKKQDVSRLTSYQLLIRDFKRYEVLGVKYGLSTVPLSLENWSGKLGWDDIAQATQQLMEERSLDYVGILTSIVGEKVEGRQILVAFKDDRLVGLKMAVEREAKETLDLRSWPDADVPALAGFQVFVWDQGIMGSRKQAAPAFDRAMRSLEALQ